MRQTLEELWSWPLTCRSVKTEYFTFQLHDIEIRFVRLHMFPDTRGWIWVTCSAVERRPPSTPNCDWWRPVEGNGSGLSPSWGWRLLLSHDLFSYASPSCVMLRYILSCLALPPLWLSWLFSPVPDWPPVLLLSVHLHYCLSYPRFIWVGPV